MAPEQAKGKSVDRRADIWAFGCVLYEMLTGKMAFRGETVTDTLAAVIKEEPDWSPPPRHYSGSRPRPAAALSAKRSQAAPPRYRRRPHLARRGDLRRSRR